MRQVLYLVWNEVLTYETLIKGDAIGLLNIVVNVLIAFIHAGAFFLMEEKRRKNYP